MTEQSVDPKLLTHPRPVNIRIEGVELGRVIAAVAVIIIHVPSSLSKYVDFAVPYFLTLSGYFLAKNLNPVSVNASPLINISLRHWRLFFFWALIYSVLPANWPQLVLHGGMLSGILETINDSLHKFVMNPINWFLDGPPGGFHLWYLACAPLAALIVFILLKCNLRWLLLPTAIASLVILNLLTSNQCAGTLQWSTKAITGIFIAIPSLVAGYEFSLRSKGREYVFLGSILIFVGAGMKVLELHSVDQSCFSTGAILIGIGMFIFLLNFPRLPGGKLWINLGKLTVGVYILHIALRPIYFSIAPKIQWFPGSLGFVILVFLTFSVVWVLIKFRIFKNWLS